MIILSVLLVLQILIFLLFLITSFHQRKIFNKETSEFIVEKSISDITVIIAAKEKYEMLESCLNSVYKSGFSDVILCLDCVEQELYNTIQKNFPTIKLLNNKQSLGKIKSQIQCLKLVNKTDILVLDADITLNQNEIQNFVNYYYYKECDFLCPYSKGISKKGNSILFGIAESDRYMRQRIIRSGRDAFGVSNLSGYCMLANKEKYLSIIDSDAIQDDVLATINLFKRGYNIKTYHKSVCFEEERSSFIPFILQKTRWTAGNILLLPAYPKLFISIPLKKSIAFTSSFLLWYWSLWIDSIVIMHSFYNPIILIFLLAEYLIKFIGLVKICDFKFSFFYNIIYIFIWPFISFLCLLLSPFFICGKISEKKTRR